MQPLSIAGTQALPGGVTCASLPGLPLPTGGADAIPVLIARGRQEGPCMVFTAGVHGDEVTGVSAIHEVVTDDLCQPLRGMVIALPILNPAGLRTSARRPYYDSKDPNRLWPEPGAGAGAGQPTPYERIATAIFALVREHANALVDLHCAWQQSIPFIYRDRVLFDGPEQRPAADALAQRIDGLARAFGLPIIDERTPAAYLRRELHRSVAGAAVLTARIPAITVELGSSRVTDLDTLATAKSGLRNALRWMGMLDGALEVTGSPALDSGARWKEIEHPHAPTSGLLRYHVRAGARVRTGAVLAELRDAWGRPQPAGSLRSEHDGWVLGLRSGLAIYEGEPVCHLAVTDSEPLVLPDPRRSG